MLDAQQFPRLQRTPHRDSINYTESIMYVASN